MTTILHIQASPRKQRSASREVAEAFIQAYLARHPEARVETLDLWAIDLPEFDEAAMAAKYAGLSGTPRTDAQRQAWNVLEALAQQLFQADVLVLSVPLWNFSIPYKLKHFIDLVTQKDILFSFDPQAGFAGLLRGKRAVVSYARGLDFSRESSTPAQRFDFQKPYIEAWLGFIGVTDVQALVVEKTIFCAEVDALARQQAVREARQLAAELTG